MSTITQEPGRQLALERIRVPDNVRPLDQAHVEALAGSIAIQGMLVPVVVRPDGEGFQLVAGFHRIGAARSLGLSRCRSSSRTARPRTPTARWRTSRHADVGMT